MAASFQKAGRIRIVLLALALCGLLIFGILWRAHHTGNSHEYIASFSTDQLSNWKQFDGIWESGQGIYSDVKGGRGDKTVTGNLNWQNYVVQTDLRFDSEHDARWGDAGIIFRVSNPAIGSDSFNGYYAGLSLPDQSLVLSREEDEFIELSTVKFPEPLQIGTWYRLKIRAQGCSFYIAASAADSSNSAALTYTDLRCKFRSGQVGLRTFSVPASWKNFQVHILP